ncbi:ANTAR domain-containing protein [Nocardia sp. ET3-3]|uniref:ANTAR domain-containing protein n=2 Tax=Nocardia terrae TaxID=2675851 RepID=A0A7K1USG6_9NOCA|nr:ANTAR domain-containing protein [Nocardia terrae]MVU77293.1 ANTAR domain-containing protein [Nocardia terrae]
MGTGSPQHVGKFRFWFGDQRWEWSDELAVMHGYRPGAVLPTTELLLAHKHPEDRAHVASRIADSVESSLPFSGRHRIVDTGGNVHEVVVVGDRMVDAEDRVIGSTGYYIDVTETLAENRQEALDDSLPELYAARAVIEQAKGVIMLVYGINADAAFRVLTWRSQETNVKLRALAAQLMADVGSLTGSMTSIRSEFDHLLLTAHERVSG